MTDRPAWMIPQGEPWRRGPEKVVFDNPWLRLWTCDATAPTGLKVVYASVSFKNLAVAVLPIDADGSVVLVGQHRFPLANYSWEIPEGGAPAGEDPLDAAKRELSEEAGLKAAEWREALRLELSNSVTDERGVGFVATGLSPAPGRPDPTESLQTARVPFREALDLALSGAMADALTVAMLLRAYHMAREGELPPALAQAMI